MLSKKLNNKGYMLVEIIIASVLAFSVAYYLLNLTYDFKDKNEDVYFSTATLSDKINITKNIMNDLEGKEVVIINNGNNYVTFQVGTTDNIKQIYIDKASKTITYGKLQGNNIDNIENNKFDVSDNSYYQKQLDSFLEFGTIKIEPSSNYISIQIPISNIYSDNTYDIKLLIKGGGTVREPSATDNIKNLYNDGSTINTVHIGGDESNPEVKLNATQGIMLDNNGDYRYYGKNPNNYVTFNNEKWRIIGVFNNVDDGTGNKETRLKIIRNESIGKYSFDSSASNINSGNGVNDWSKSDLMNELNTLYYSSTSGTCYNGKNNVSTTCNFTNTGLKSESKNMIADAVYHMGGPANDALKTSYAHNYYLYERNGRVYNCSVNDGACPRVTTWTGKIGLIYPSDYAYATDLSKCTSAGYYYNDSNCKDNDWLLYSSSYWTLAPYSYHGQGAFEIHPDGHIYGYIASDVFDVRPVVYLKSNIAITGGTGTSSDPYKLSI